MYKAGHKGNHGDFGKRGPNEAFHLSRRVLKVSS
jgi:hypothetical protein